MEGAGLEESDVARENKHEAAALQAGKLGPLCRAPRLVIALLRELYLYTLGQAPHHKERDA